MRSNRNFLYILCLSGDAGADDIQNSSNDVEKTPSAPQRADMRIYTIDEANQVAGKTSHVKIRYR